MHAGRRARQARQSDEDMKNIGKIMQAGQTEQRGMKTGKGLE
jgi:hypothetical protein